MQGCDVTKQVKWRYTLLPVSKVRSNESGVEGPSHSKQDGGCVFPAFVQVVHNHLFSCKLFSLFLLLTDKNTYSCKSDLFANYKNFQCSLYFSMHSEWRYSLVCTSVSSSRRCWSLDLVRMCLFVMSIFTPLCFIFFI